MKWETALEVLSHALEELVLALSDHLHPAPVCC